INKALIKALGLSFENLNEIYQDGISDLVYQGRKIAGTSLFRSRNYLLYQASLLYEPRVDLMNRYLAHPTREPSYRQGKSHADFVLSLSHILNDVGILDVKAGLEKHLQACLKEQLVEDMIEVQTEQVPHLLRKCSSHNLSAHD